MDKFNVTWYDAGLEPQCKPNPAFPRGKHVRIGLSETICTAPLPYPAKRIGHYFVECKSCGATAAVTTAGRPDDPVAVDIPCKVRHHA